MRHLSAFFIFISAFFNSPAQSGNDSLFAEGVRADSLFWIAYNRCDVEGMMQFVPADLEFYHDKGGITRGDTAFEATIRNGLCKDQNAYRLRRAAVTGKNQAHKMMKDGKLYGVLMAGSHLFYLSQNGSKEHADGLAQFADLWLLHDGKWKLSRVFSYDHVPAPYVNERSDINVSKSLMRSYAGTYKGPGATLTLEIKRDTLMIPMGNHLSPMFAEKPNLFFLKERDLTFEFIRSNNVVNKMIVRENGKIVEELDRLK